MLTASLATSSRVPANARRENDLECMAAGMDGHLSKPFDRQDMEEAIAKILSLKSAA